MSKQKITEILQDIHTLRYISLHFEDNSSKLVKIDTWYAPEESLRREFNKGIENLNIGIDNPHRAFEMFLVTGVENKQFNVNIDYLKEE